MQEFNKIFLAVPHQLTGCPAFRWHPMVLTSSNGHGAPLNTLLRPEKKHIHHRLKMDSNVSAVIIALGNDFAPIKLTYYSFIPTESNPVMFGSK